MGHVQKLFNVSGLKISCTFFWGWAFFQPHSFFPTNARLFFDPKGTVQWSTSFPSFFQPRLSLLFNLAWLFLNLTYLFSGLALRSGTFLP